MDFQRLCLNCMREGLQNGSCVHCGAPASFVQEPPFALPLGTVLHGQYLTGAVLGCGGFGITYIAMDLKAERRVAIKEYFPNGLSARRSGETQVNSRLNADDFRYGLHQFLAEARTIYECRGTPHIISVEKLFEENGTAYYAMEYLNGQDLKRFLQAAGGSLSYPEALQLLLPVFDALSYVHSRGIIHRDISPDNIYIYEDATVKLLDFGAARASLQEKSQSMDVILKRGYAPEEQYRSHGHQGPWTDVYALACTLYHCVTGRVPPEATQRAYRDECSPASQFCTNLPAQAGAALQKAMAVQSEARYQTVEEFKTALLEGEKPVQERAIVSSPVNPASTNRKTVITSKPEMTQANAALPFKRFAAFLIDNFLLGALLSFVYFQAPAISESAFGLPAFLGTFVYGLCFEASSIHTTLGKKAVKLRVYGKNGEDLSLFGIVVRNLIKGIPFLFSSFFPAAAGMFLFADGIAALVTGSKQTLHDLAAKSIVLPPFSFSASLVPVPDSPSSSSKAGVFGLQCVSGQFAGTFFSGEPRLVLGRDPQQCSIVFPNDAMGVSSLHCEVVCDRATASMILKDLGSTYGTFVSDGRRLASQEKAVLRNGDSFTIGDANTFFVTIQGKGR